jgi:MFS family permease
MGDVVDGLKYAFGTPGINWLMVLMMTIAFWGAMQPVIPLYARDILNVGADGCGLIFGAAAAGALVSSIAIFIASDVKHKPRWILGATYIFAASMLGFAYSTNFSLSVFLYFLSGIGGGIWVTFMFTMLQTAVADEMRGRVVGVAIASLQLLGVGMLLGGALADLVSPWFALVSTSIAWAAVTILAFLKSKELRSFS